MASYQSEEFLLNQLLRVALSYPRLSHPVIYARTSDWTPSNNRCILKCPDNGIKPGPCVAHWIARRFASLHLCHQPSSDTKKKPVANGRNFKLRPKWRKNSSFTADCILWSLSCIIMEESLTSTWETTGIHVPNLKKNYFHDLRLSASALAGCSPGRCSIVKAKTLSDSGNRPNCPSGFLKFSSQRIELNLCVLLTAFNTETSSEYLIK